MFKEAINRVLGSRIEPSCHLEISVFGRRTEIGQDDSHKTFVQQTRWWSDPTMEAILLLVDQLATQPQQNKILSRLDADYAIMRLFYKVEHWFGSKSEPFLGESCDPYPIMSLQQDWMTGTTCSAIASTDNTHSFSLSIFGLEKFVVIFDGQEGRYDQDMLCVTAYS